MLSMSFGAIPGPLQLFSHCFNNITAVQKHTEVLPMDSQGLSWFTSIQSTYQNIQLPILL